jgi:glycosyltransferase involved in cell wall biosynthesis
VVCVGRLTRQKGQDLLLRAWPAVAVHHPHPTLVCVGTGDVGPSLVDGAPGRTRFVGEVADPRPWYAAADVVVQPSRWEGLPLTVLEALAGGRSVIGTSVPGIRDLLPPDATVRPEDPAALAAAIDTRLTNPSLVAADELRATRLARAHDLRTTLDRLAVLTTAGRPAYRPDPAVVNLVPAPRQAT